MPNEFFDHTTVPATGSALSSATMRAEFDAIESGFDKLPTLATNGGEIVAVNSGATALEAIATTGSGSGVRATSPTLVTPVLGVATATSINKLTLTAPATGSTLTLADGKTLTASNTLTLAGTDGTTLTFPTTSATLARTDAAQTFTGVQTMTSPAITTPAFTGAFSGTYSLGGTPTINVAAAVGGAWTAAATWIIPAHTLGGAVTGGGQNVSGLGTVGCGAITSSGAISAQDTLGTFSATPSSVAQGGRLVLNTLQTVNTAARNWVWANSYTSYGDCVLRVSTALGGDPVAAGTTVLSATSTGLSLGSLALTAGTGTFTKATAGDSLIFTNGGASNKTGYLYSDANSVGIFSSANAGGSTPGIYLEVPSNTARVSINGSDIGTFSSTGLAVTGTLSATGDVTLASTSGIAQVGGSTRRAWDVSSGSSALGIGGSGLYAYRSIQASLVHNAYVAASDGNWKYDSTAAAGKYSITGNVHTWGIAASGTAGNTVTFTDAMTLDASGNLGLGVTPSAWWSSMHAIQTYGASGGVFASASANGHFMTNTYYDGTNWRYISATSYPAMRYVQDNSGEHSWHVSAAGTAGNPITFTQAMTLDASGSLLAIGSITSGSSGSRAFISVVAGNTESFNSPDTCIYVSKDTVTSRSINAGGTINASGADYAEYERNNGLSITKGSIVGFKADGTLTLTYADAVRFGIKSTNPSYVGGDTWGSEEVIGLARPTKPAATEDQTQYEADLAAFNAALEVERQKVDRIAYSGKVPVNVMGATAGGYIVAFENDQGNIDGLFVADPDFAQYKKAVGRVNRILEDGRAEVAVMVH